MGGNTMKMNKKGFTLIELLIVVAIIAILAAIAIPQFSSYRVRGYNSAAASDLRNMKLAITAFSTDNAAYASTVGCVTAVPACANTGPGAPAAPIGGPLAYSISTAQYTIVPGQIPAADVIWSLGLSSGVNAAITTGLLGANYAATAGHTSGDTIFAAHSQATSLMRAGKTTPGGIPTLVTAGAPGGPMTFVPPSTGIVTADLPAPDWVSM
jgi:prepilin-type N-terminal cleavage/methylation domain-containing protein